MSLPRARPESLTVSTPPRPDSPLVGTPQSAIISVPPDWASASPAGSSSRASLDSEAYRMVSLLSDPTYLFVAP